MTGSAQRVLHPTRAAALGGITAIGLSGCGFMQRLRHHIHGTHGCTDVPIPSGGHVVMLRGRLPTQHVAAPVNYVLVVPAALRRPVEAVAYILPGRGGTANGVMDGLGFAQSYARTIHNRAVPMMLATIDAGESYFHPRTSGEDRLAAVTIDLARVARTFAKRPLREALIGQSMGGYGALLAAEREPTRFASVAVAGPALFVSYDDERSSVGDAFDDGADFARNDVVGQAARLQSPVMVRCGDQDPFVPGVRAFAKACPSADVRIVPGCHTDGFWRATAFELLRFTTAHAAWGSPA